MLEQLGLMAIAGFCAKIVDEISERKLADMAGRSMPVIWPILLAVIYGLTMGWLASQTILGPLLIALAAASILAGKIDHPYHMLGAACFAAMFAFLPLLSFAPWWFAIFLVSGLLDELRLGGLERGPLALLNRERLWTPLSALAIWLFFGATPLFILAIVCFDIAYRFGKWCVELRYPIGERKREPAARKSTTGRKSARKRH